MGLAGTFDHLHEGHKYLIKTALSISEKIEIGITSESLLKDKKFFLKLEDYSTRKKNLIQFIQSLNAIERVAIVDVKEWDDMSKYVLNPNYEGLILSHETYSNGVKLNNMREKHGLNPLVLIVIPIIKNNEGKKISSTLMREKL